MAECGKPVGKGVVNYPCVQESGHAGPCASMENAASQRERARWLESQDKLRREEATAQRAAGSMVAPIVASLAMATALPCEPCKDGLHGDCDFLYLPEKPRCGCFQTDPNMHLGVEDSGLVEAPCEACFGMKVIARRTAFTEALGLPPEEVPCEACEGKGVKFVPAPEMMTNPYPTKQRAGDQPLPTVNGLPFIQDAVIADIEVRKQVGIERYGTPLQAFNGRNADLDAYEEAIDLTQYLKQRLIERAVMIDAVGQIVAHLQTEGGALNAPPNVISAIEALQRGLGYTVSGGASEA